MGFSKNNDSADGLGADLSGNGEHKYLYDAHDLSGITYADDLGHPGSLLLVVFTPLVMAKSFGRCASFLVLECQRKRIGGITNY